MPPPPAEAAILAQFLLGPAQLPAVLALDDFAALFPKRLQHAHAAAIRALYRDLQRQRALQVDDVADAIEAEVARSRQLRRHVLRAHLQAAAQEDAGADDELQIERVMMGNSSIGTDTSNGIEGTSLSAIVEDLDAAADDLEADLRQLADEEARLRSQLQQTVGGLSDLRYGRLTNPQLREQVLEGLQSVQNVCEAATSAKTGTRT